MIDLSARKIVSAKVIFMFLNLRNLPLIKAAITVVSLVFYSFAAKLNVDKEGLGSYPTISDALSASNAGDTIWIMGSNIDSYDETWPSNIDWIVHIMGAFYSPDSFPSVRLTGEQWEFHWINTSGTTRIERVILDNCDRINLTNAGRILIIDKCVIKNFSADVFLLKDNASNYLSITNSIFHNNATIFPAIPYKNINGPYGSVFNCTFYNNTTVQAEDNINAVQISAGKFINITNCIFSGNTTILVDDDLKSAYTYNLLPTSESGWGTGSVYSDNPRFINSTPTLPSHFNIQSSSPAREAGTFTGAPAVDIRGVSRTGACDIGAYEYPAAGGGADYTWDVSTSGGIQADSGTWGTNNYWTLSSGGGTSLVAWPGAGNSATFAGANGDYTINVNGTQIVDSISFLYNGYYLKGGVINLGSKSGIYVASGRTARIGSVIAGIAGIKIYGANGELRLEGNNTFSGASTIFSGKPKLIHPNSLGSTSGGTTIITGACVQLSGKTTFAPEQLFINGTGTGNGVVRTPGDGINDTVTWSGKLTMQSSSSIGATEAADILTISGVIEGAFQLTSVGPGTKILSGVNTFSGGLVIAEGITKAGNGQALGSFGNTITISSGAALDINGYNLQGYTQNIVINGQVDANTGAIINTASGEQLNAIRQISLGSNASIGNNGGRFDIGRGYTGAVRVTGNNHTLTKVGNNFVALLADATTLAGLIINGGQISLESNAAAGNAPITINNGAILSSWGNRTFTNNITINNGGQLNSPSSNSYTTVHNGNISLSGNTVMHNDAANTMTIGGVIDGTGNLTKTGANGTIILSNTNTYTGSITVSAGTLIVNGATSASSAMNVSSGANLGGTGNVAGTVNIAGNGIISPGHGGAGTLRTGTLNLNNTSVLNYELGASRDSIRVNGNLTLDGQLNITAIAGFGVGNYTLMTCSGTITNNTLIVNNAPSGYIYSISVTAGSVILKVSAAPQDTLILRYKFDESSGSVVYDSSGFGNDGTAINNPSFITGFSGNSIALDGSNDYVQIPSGIVNSCEDITVCTWIRLETISDWTRIFDFGNSYTTGYMFLAPTGGSLRFAITKTSSGSEQKVDAPMFSVNVWKHVAVRIKGDSAQIYIDGVAAATNAAVTNNPSDLGSTTYNYIGKSQYADPYLDGVVEDFRIYSYALTPQNIASIYNSTRPVYFTWDSSSSAGYQAANGTWGTDNYWSPDGYVLMSWPGAGNSAIFAGADSTYEITVNGTQNVDSIAFLNSGYILNGGTLNFGSKNAIYLANGKSATINSVISGTGGMNFSTPGGTISTLNLGGENSYSGVTTIRYRVRLNVMTLANGGSNSSIGSAGSAAANLVIDGGQLRTIGGAVSTNRLFTVTDLGGYLYSNASGPTNFTGTGSIEFPGTGSRTLEIGGIYSGSNIFAPVIGNGAGTTLIRKTGSTSTWILTGNNTYTGTTSIQGGTLQIGNGGTSGSIAGNVVNDDNLVFNRSDSYIYSGVISGTGTVNQAGSGTLIFTGANTFTGAATVSAGTLQIGNGGTTGSLTSDITNNGTLVFNRSNNYTYNGVVSGNGSVRKAGNETLTLSGTHTYTGTTDVTAGTLNVTGSLAQESAVTVSGTLAGNGTVAGAVNANGGTISPGDNGAGTLSTGPLTLNSSSVLNFELGTSKDSIKVTGDLTLDGTLNVSALAGFGLGSYTLITCTGTLTNNILSPGKMPDGYSYVVSISAKSVILTVEPAASLKPVTVVQSAPRCSVYTDDWTIVFDNGAGGGITALTDSVHGKSSGQGNQIGAGQNLYYIYYDGERSKTNGKGTWSVLKAEKFYAIIRQSGTLSGLPYTTDYTVHGSGKIYIKTTISNTGGNISSKTVRCVVERRAVPTMRALRGNDNAWQCPYLLLSSDSAKQHDILLTIKDLWSTSAGAANSATGFYTNAGSGYTGYELSNAFSLNAGQKQVWEYMLDFVHHFWDDTANARRSSDDYRSPDSLEMISGTLLFEKAWERQLRGHWKMDEGSGDTLRDNSGNNHHAKTTGTWTDGRWGGGIRLNGAQNATVPDNSDFDGTDFFTVMGWVKANNGTFTNSAWIAGKHNGSNGWKLTGNGSDQLVLTCNGTAITGTRDVADGSWHHVAACFSPSKVILYVDGRLDKISTGSYSVTENNSDLLIGAGLTGDLDDVRYCRDYISENSLKAIYQQGFRSSEGFYELRADNNNTVHFKIDGADISRCFPVFHINNYWAESKPKAGCVVLNGTALVENTDYYAVFDNQNNTLTIGLNKIISMDQTHLYIDDGYSAGYQMAEETRKMSWGIDNQGSYQHFWVKNFSGSSFGDENSGQWYLNWKMSTEGNSKDGEIWYYGSSVNNPNSSVDTSDTNTNMVPGYDNYYDSWGYVCLNIGSGYPKTSYNVSNAFTYAVEESSDVRVVLCVNERQVDNGSSFNIKTRWTIYPTGQIFRWDSIYSMSAAPSKVYIGAFMDDQEYATVYTNTLRKRSGLIYSQTFPDFAFSWLSMKNASGFQAEPFGSDTIMPDLSEYRAGMDFSDASATEVWNSASVQTVLYLDIQHSNMSNSFIDSVSNSVQCIGTSGGAALLMKRGVLLSGDDATEGDLNGDGFNEREGAYIIQADNNTVNFILPARNDTCRFNPAFRLTGYYVLEKPQYIFLYNSSGDTIPVIEGYKYNAYHKKSTKELVIQFDSVFCDSVGIYISADRTLAVNLSGFWAKAGNSCDTLGWSTGSELENLGYYLYRRIKPEFFDSLSKAADSDDGNGVVTLLKERVLSWKDTSWVLLNNEIIPGAPAGVSHGPRNYVWIDKSVHNGVLYEYKLVSVDFRNTTEEFGPVEAMPFKLVSHFNLGPNFPNPFRGTTVIRFELPAEGRVTLNVFNLQGRLVRRLLTPEKVLGTNVHQVIWDGRNDLGRELEAGPYIYRLTSGKLSRSKIMVKLE